MGLLGSGGGILGIILNGIQNTQAGLPFLAGPEERVGKRQMDLETQKEAFKTEQETRKAVITAITDIFKSPEKQTTETLKWARDMAPQVGLEVPEGTLAGMYGQAYDKLVQGKQMRELTDIKVQKEINKTKGLKQSSISPASLPNYKTPDEIPYSKELLQAAQEQGIKDPAHYIAMNSVESSFNPTAVSPKGARGLGQIMPDTALQYGTNPKQLFDPVVNANTSAKIYKDLENKFDGNKDLIAAAYNAGPGAVLEHGGIPPYKETQDYIQKVNTQHKHYAQLLGSPTTTDATPIAEPLQQVGPNSYKVPSTMGFDPEVSTMHIDKDGNPSLDFKPSTMSDYESQAFSQLSPFEQMSFIESKFKKDAGMEPVKGTIQSEVDGKMYGYITDPSTGSTKVWPLSPMQVKETPQDKIETSARGAALTRKSTAAAGLEKLDSGITVGEAETQAKGPPEEIRKAMVEAKASSAFLGRLSQDITDDNRGPDYKGADGKTYRGKFDMNNLPVGPLTQTRETFERYLSAAGLTENDYLRKRQNFIAAASKAISKMYSIGGKQLSDKELDQLKLNKLNPELTPQEWISRFALEWEDAQDYAKGQIDVWGRNFDVTPLKEAYEEASKLNPWLWLPPNLRPKRVQRASEEK